MATNDTQLREAFASPDSRIECTVVAIDMVNSAAMKEQQPQATWLSSLGYQYDVVGALASRAVPGVLVKYLGDGIMLVFDSDHPTQAVNVAIQVQEAITEASKGTTGGRVIDFMCSVGIATGEAIRFSTPSGAPDVVGSIVDKAFRLCGAANAQAIFVDAATIGAANTMKIRSAYGLVVGRTSDEYAGAVQKAMLKGFAQPVLYHEVLWSHQLFGVKSANVTASTDRLAVQPRPALSGPSAAPRAAAPTERHRGIVKFWNAEKGFGFITDPDTGEEFHFKASLMVYPEDIDKMSEGREVAFVAVAGPKNRQAGAILVVGQGADGPIISLPKDKPHGWVRVEDSLGHRHLVYVPVSELVGRKVGQLVSFIVGANTRGSCAQQLETFDDDQAA